MSQVTPFMVIDRAIYALNEQEYNHVYASFMGGGPEAATEAELKEYARRAAAALNACKNIPTESLEAVGEGGIGEFMGCTLDILEKIAQGDQEGAGRAVGAFLGMIESRMPWLLISAGKGQVNSDDTDR